MPSPQLENIGMALQGLGAGLGGQLPQFLQIQNQRQGLQRQEQMDNLAMAEKRQQMAIERQKTVFTDANSALQLVDQGNLDGVVRLGIQRLQMLKQLSELDPSIDPSDTQRVTRLAIAARNGDEEALDNLKGELNNTVEIGRAIGVLASPEVEEFTLSPGQARFRGDEQIASLPESTQQEPAAVQALRIRAAEANLQPGTPAYAEFMRSGGAGAGVNVTTNVQAPGENKYIETRAAQQAATMGELEKSAESAYRANQALDRFIASSATGDAGGAQPLITGVKSFLSSFGFDPAGLTDTAIMQQAVGDILGAKMAELGARGLTDKDMQVLRDALPQVNSSHEARIAVADIIKRANQNILREYDTQVQYEEQNYPDASFRRPSWAAGLREQLQSSPINDPLGILK